GVPVVLDLDTWGCGRQGKEQAQGPLLRVVIMSSFSKKISAGTQGIEAGATVNQVATIHLLGASSRVIDPAKAHRGVHLGVTRASGPDKAVAGDRLQEWALFLIAQTPEVRKTPDREQVHVNRDSGRSIPSGQPLLSQNEVQEVGPPPAEFC